MKMQKRRRIERRTDYKARLALLKSGKPRLVIRKTNHYIIAQVVQADKAQDKVVIGMTSNMLLQKGWPHELRGSLKSLSAAYLTGFLLGSLAKEKFKEVILDIGMNRNIQKSRIFAVLKGALDAGLNVPHNEKALPSLEQIKSNTKTSSLLVRIQEKIKT